ncbi:sulfurtransferase-like selenium metabolism protein YedF [Candidatus Zixiibacteriota bacterium]
MNRIVFISSSQLGSGEPELGEALMQAFLDNLKKVEPPPAAVIFMNTGVHLAAADAPTVDNLKVLAESGVDILSCGTCLDYYDLLDDVAVGRVSNMTEIVTILANADGVITP